MTTILFACTHNAGRSQMAAASCTYMAGGIEARERALLASLDANR